MILWSVLKNTDILSGMCLRAYFDKNAYLTVTIVIHFCLDFSPCCFFAVRGHGSPSDASSFGYL